MKISPAGVALIKQFEGVKLKAYLDSAGVWTIGYGHTKSARSGQVITQAQAEALLAADIQEAEDDLNRSLAAAGLDPTQGQFDALMSWVFNLGITNFNGSTAYRLMKEGAPEAEIAEALTWWNKARDPKTGMKVALPGLTRRRKAEADLFLGEQPDRPKPLVQTKTVQGAVIAGAASALPLLATVTDQLANVAPMFSEMSQALKPFATAGSWVALAVTLLGVAGAALAVYGRWKLRQEAQQKPEGAV